MQQAALVDGPGLDFLSLSEDGFGPAEVDVDGCEIAQALIIAVVIILLDEGCPSKSPPPSASLFRVSVSSPLLGGFDEPETLRYKVNSDVPGALTPDT